MEQRTIVDDAIVNLMYYYIFNASYLAEVMLSSSKALMKDPDLTPQARTRVRHDRQNTDQILKQLLVAKEHWAMFCRAMEAAQRDMDTCIQGNLQNYDHAQGSAYQMLAFDMAQFCLVAKDESNPNASSNAQKIEAYLRKFKWPDGLEGSFNILMEKAGRLRRLNNWNTK